MKRKGLTGMAAALMFSLSVTNMSPLAAVADQNGSWEQSAQTGEWSYRLGQGLVQNEWLLCQGKWYRFDAAGKMITGWYQDQESKNWYYLGADGAMVTGWAAVNGRWYYMNQNGQMLADQMTPDGYQVNADGAWVNEAGIPYSAPIQTGSTTGSTTGSGSTSGGSGSSSGSSGSHSGESSSSGSSSGNNSSSNSGSNSGSGSDSSNGSDNSNNGTAGDENQDNGNSGDVSNDGDGKKDDENKTPEQPATPDKPGESDKPNESEKPGEPEQPEKTALLVESQTKLIDLGWSQYVIVAFAKGYSLENCKILVDGVNVTDAFSKVDDEGTLVKWELTDLYPRSVSVVAENGTTQTVRLSDNQTPTAPHAEQKSTAPSAFLAHGSVYVWDYHLTNYDEDGNVRVHPGKTTFSLGQKSNAILYYSPDAELTEDESNLYGVGGQAVIMFNYTTEADKQWFDAISDVDLVADNGNNSTLNDNLNYEKKLADHNGNEVGQIVVPLGQSNFYSNGRYYLRVRSGGKSTLFPIHVVNGTAPSMKLSEAGAIKSGQNVHFKMENMTYGVTMPIYRVELTVPDGTTRELEKITDWYLIGDSFVLYNDVNAENGRDNIPDSGLYTLTIYADGFKNVSTTFQVGSVEASQEDSGLYGIDIMSSATTGGGGSSSGDASDGGSDTMSADLLFDADLLANALLLDELGVENEYASAIADRWLSDMSGYDAVLDSDGKEFYSFTDYRNAVEEAKVAGKYLTFAEYIKSGQAATTPNRPYAVKEVMEDNLLGQTQTNGSYLGKDVPVLTLVDENGEKLEEAKENSEVRFAGADETYMELLMENAKIFVNGVSYEAISSEKYRVDGSQLIFDASVFKLGNNTFTVKMDGYKDNIVNVSVAKTLSDASLSVEENLKTGNDVEITTADESGDFFQYISKVELTRPDGSVKTVLPDGQESVYEKVGYEVSGNTLTLGKDLFEEEGTYTLKIYAEYYDAQEISFTLEKDNSEIGGDEQKPAQIQKTEKDFFGDYSLLFGMGNDEWMNAITEITVNGTIYEKGFVWNNTSYSLAVTDGKISLGNAEFTEEVNEVVISAEGYEDLTVKMNKNGSLADSDDSGDNGEIGDEDGKLAPAEVKSAEKSFFGDYDLIVGMENDEWMNAITEIAVNGTTYEKGFVWNNTSYSLAVTDGKISLGNAEFTDEVNEVVISAEGYEDLTVWITKDGKLTEEADQTDASSETPMDEIEIADITEDSAADAEEKENEIETVEQETAVEDKKDQTSDESEKKDDAEMKDETLEDHQKDIQEAIEEEIKEETTEEVNDQPDREDKEREETEVSEDKNDADSKAEEANEADADAETDAEQDEEAESLIQE